MTTSETETSEESRETRDDSGSWKISAVIIVVILLAAGGIAALTFFTEPTAKKGGATKKTAMLVEVMPAEQGTYRPAIVATGTVEPQLDVVLRPQVAGRIVGRAAEFTPGGFVEKGATLIRIESADFEHALAQRKSDLRQALSDLAVEQGRQDVARADYSYLGEEIPPEKEALVLREPQLEAARGRVDAARAAVDQAELNLRRTTVKAPFDAHILRRDVNTGSQVAPNDTLGRLVGQDTYWVAVDLPLEKLRWVSIPEDDGDGSRVEVRNRTSWPEGTSRSGHLHRLVGALDGSTRMARVLAEIPDPLARGEDAEGKPPLMIGEFVEVRIHGVEVEDVIRLNRDHVRDDDTVWIMEDGKLQVKEADIVVRDAEYAYISSGLEEGDQVVTTNLSTVTEGAPLRVEGSEKESADE